MDIIWIVIQCLCTPPSLQTLLCTQVYLVNIFYRQEYFEKRECLEIKEKFVWPSSLKQHNYLNHCTRREDWLKYVKPFLFHWDKVLGSDRCFRTVWNFHTTLSLIEFNMSCPYTFAKTRIYMYALRSLAMVNTEQIYIIKHLISLWGDIVCDCT